MDSTRGPNNRPARAAVAMCLLVPKICSGCFHETEAVMQRCPHHSSLSVISRCTNLRRGPTEYYLCPRCQWGRLLRKLKPHLLPGTDEDEARRTARATGQDLTPSVEEQRLPQLFLQGALEGARRFMEKNGGSSAYAGPVCHTWRDPQTSRETWMGALWGFITSKSPLAVTMDGVQRPQSRVPSRGSPRYTNGRPPRDHLSRRPPRNPSQRSPRDPSRRDPTNRRSSS